VLRDRNPDFVTLANGDVRNGYTLKLMNRMGKPRTLALSVTGLAMREVNIIGLGRVTLPASLEVATDKVRTLRVLVTVDRTHLAAGPQPVTFVLADPALGESRKVETVFVSGRAR
jgi:polyferredoxin